MADAGLPGVEASVWNGFFVPSGTPKPIIDTLSTFGHQAACGGNKTGRRLQARLGSSEHHSLQCCYLHPAALCSGAASLHIENPRELPASGDKAETPISGSRDALTPKPPHPLEHHT
jgi:hypothetical protein